MNGYILCNMSIFHLYTNINQDWFDWILKDERLNTYFLYQQYLDLYINKVLMNTKKKPMESTFAMNENSKSDLFHIWNSIRIFSLSMNGKLLAFYPGLEVRWIQLCTLRKSNVPLARIMFIIHTWHRSIDKRLYGRKYSKYSNTLIGKLLWGFELSGLGPLFIATCPFCTKKVLKERFAQSCVLWQGRLTHERLALLLGYSSSHLTNNKRTVLRYSVLIVRPNKGLHVFIVGGCERRNQRAEHELMKRERSVSWRDTIHIYTPCALGNREE